MTILRHLLLSRLKKHKGNKPDKRYISKLKITNHSNPSHPQPCVWKIMYVMVNAIKRLKLAQQMVKYIPFPSDLRWGWLDLGGCFTLPAGLKPCSGGKGRWSYRNIKPFGNCSRGLRGPIYQGFILSLKFEPSVIGANAPNYLNSQKLGIKYSIFDNNIIYNIIWYHCTV